MSVHEPAPFRAAIPSVDADRAVKFGVGVAAAPLWATFFTAASAGMAYWWMTAWARGEPKSFAPWTGAARTAAKAPAPVPTVEAEPRRPEPAQSAPRPAASSAPEPAKAVATPPAPAPEPSASVEAQPAHHPVHDAPAPGAFVAAAPVAAGLEPAVEPDEIAAVVEQVKSTEAASRGDGAKAPAPAAAQRKPPARRRPEPKA